MSSHEDNGLCEDASPSSSFLGCPFKDSHGNIYGVMRIIRSFPGSVFTDEDLALLSSVSNRLTVLIERKELLEKNLRTLSKINAQINSSFGTDDQLKPILLSILEAATETLGFEFAAIHLVNPVQNTIATVMGMLNKEASDAVEPNDWVGTSHPLDPADESKRDIHAWLLREHKEPCIIPGWHPHFNREIYEKYHHEKLIRAFVPIVTQNTNDDIGTIDAGYHIDRRNFIDAKQMAMNLTVALKET